MKGIATDLFKKGNFLKALKVYGKVHSYFRTKDAKNNFQKEDETTEEFIRLTQDLDVINKTTLTNICVIHSKNKAWKEVLKYAEEALLTDPNYPKALYHKGKAQIELSDFIHALESLNLAAQFDPGNSEIKKEIARGEQLYKKY